MGEYFGKGMLILMGLAFAAAGGFLLYKNISFMLDETTIKVTGLVTDFHTHEDSEGSTLCQPKIMFETLDGRQFSFFRAGSSNPCGVDLGEAVTVYYSSHNPKEAMLLGLFMTFIFPSIFLLIGVGLSVWVFLAD